MFLCVCFDLSRLDNEAAVFCQESAQVGWAEGRRLNGHIATQGPTRPNKAKRAAVSRALAADDANNRPASSSNSRFETKENKEKKNDCA